MAVARAEIPWRDPLDALAAVADEPGAFALLSDGSPGARWSYVGARPVRTVATLAGLREAAAEGGGDGFPCLAVGLASYEWGATLEPTAPQPRTARWPDLAAGVYAAALAFDHAEGRAWAVGRGATVHEAQACCEDVRALFFERSPPLPPSPSASPGLDPGVGRGAPRRFPSPSGDARADGSAPGSSPGATESGKETGAAFTPLPGDYPAAVAAVVEAVAAGEIFQANIARAWTGTLAPNATPFDILAALRATSPAPFAAYLRLPGLAVVSNSPERFLAVEGGRAFTQPIKGTRPRGADPAADAALAAELLASPKDRAENRMIVDLMRNDLSRVCEPGTVEVEAFCALESYTNVHHLVSTVSGRLARGRGVLDLFAAAFPPGSVTGAPKLQAQAVIARHEPPRGPYCGSIFRLGADGGFDSSVLIRTLAFEEEADGGWRWQARAGAGITADSLPADEDAEALAKIAAIRRVLGG